MLRAGCQARRNGDFAYAAINGHGHFKEFGILNRCQI